MDFYPKLLSVFASTIRADAAAAAAVSNILPFLIVVNI